MAQLLISSDGRLRCLSGTREVIAPSPVGILYHEGRAQAPVSARQDADTLTLTYPCGDAVLRMDECAGYHKLTVLSVPEGTQTFVFGPYVTAGTSFGEVLGAAWHDDGSAVCIQSLQPKVEGGIRHAPAVNDTGIDLSPRKAADAVCGTVTLQCCISDHSRRAIVDTTGLIPGYEGHARAIVEPIPGADGLIAGACVALIAADSADALLDVICGMELAEDLPHSMYNGQWAKKNRYTNSVYMIFSGAGLTAEERIAMAQRAGAGCVYLSDMLKAWGHFTIDRDAYPGGRAGIRALSERAAASGLTIGTHTLSNFITTDDAFVTPVPHPGLLVMDETVLTADIPADAADLPIRDANNYAEANVLNALRIGEELITFTAFDPERCLLTGCTRGAFGTSPSSHAAGETVYRLWDHGYRTLFPSLTLQNEMVDNMAQAMLECGVSRLSFDGLEGCFYPGVGDYGPAEFVRRLFKNMNNAILCDASIAGHYLWHALSYANWGEPWWDSARRGGMHAYRVNNQAFFRRNLMPAMFGWFRIFENAGKFEATPPENLEYMLSRSAAFDACLAMSIEASAVRNHGLMGQYLDCIRLWEDFRYNADIPADVRAKMQEEQSNWHLEAAGDGWKLTSLAVRALDMEYCDRDVANEAGTIYQARLGTDTADVRYHCTTMELDAPFDGVPGEVLHFRIRVGRPGHGRMYSLRLAGIGFSFDAAGGDYLEYKGGTTLLHYDRNFNLKGIIEGIGEEIRMPGGVLFTHCHYVTDHDEAADYIFTEIRPKVVWHIRRR